MSFGQMSVCVASKINLNFTKPNKSMQNAIVHLKKIFTDQNCLFSCTEHWPHYQRSRDECCQGLLIDHMRLTSQGTSVKSFGFQECCQQWSTCYRNIRLPESHPLVWCWSWIQTMTSPQSCSWCEFPQNSVDNCWTQFLNKFVLKNLYHKPKK